MNVRKTALFVALGVCLAVVLMVTNGSIRLAQAQPGEFIPPDRVARRAAIGSTQQLPRPLRKAFVESDSFSPIPKPNAGDWLASHQEQGQTFAQFVRGNPNRPDQRRHTLYFVPLGDYDESVGPKLKSLEAFATAFFGMPVKTLPARSLEGLPIKIRQRSGGPDQLLSTDVLDWLKPQVPDDAYCLLAITMQDLYPDEQWNFVFGQASLGDRVGVYSFVRYTPAFNGKATDRSTDRKIIRRSCQVLAHETGHMFGVRHCVHFHCLMNGSNSLGESDRQPMHLCPVCLRKLHWSVKFDVAKRYESLRQFSEDAGWDSEQQWLTKRLGEVK